MLIQDLFPKIDQKKIEEVLQKHHVEVPADFQFSETNIIIGPNGAGKTRLLNAIKELYSLDKKTDVLYGYFPALSDRCVSKESSEESDLPEWTLKDFLYMKNVSFSDFFREIEKQNKSFLRQLLEYHSQQQKQQSEKTILFLEKVFLLLMGKKLGTAQGSFYVEKNQRIKRLTLEIDRFSPGELMLFYMSIFLSLQGEAQNEKIIILDEPECHLHPKALLRFIDVLTEFYKFNKVWIATHSLFLVPQFQFENIIYINDSSVQKRNSLVYQDILSEVLGDENGNISLFFSSLSQWQYCEFIAQCFTNPTVVDIVNPNDEQVQLFITYFDKHKPFRILDCGGGSGRLGLSIEAARVDDAKDLIYDIYDKNPTYSGKKYSVYTELSSIHHIYNCVVMMNFLHEVKPVEWVPLIRYLYKIMEEKAYLLFIEVTTLAQGEMPNEIGYLVLGKEELQILFSDNSGLIEIRNDAKKDKKQKSSCFLIPRKSLFNVSPETVQNAVSHLQERALREIKGLRKSAENGQMNSANARRYAFLLQQYINAKLFIDENKRNEKKDLTRPLTAYKIIT